MRKTSDIIWQDAQHQVLFEILDLIKKPGSDRLVLEKLRDYSEDHFAIEEQYMLKLEYPGRDEHMKAHEIFRSEIKNMLTDHQQHDAVFMDIIATFLTEWLTRHVFGIDKQLEAYILQSNAK